MNKSIDSLPVHSFLFNSAEFNVYGTNEEPLFLVNDVVCGLLGMDRPLSNHFFRDNRVDCKYIHRCCFSTAPQEIQSRIKNNQNSTIHFFTEKGLYKCLMRSNKPIAELFQDEICDLLKNIRIGNVSIHIKQIEELEKQLTDTQESRDSAIAEYKARLVDVEQQLDTASTKLKKATKKLGIYEVRIGNKVYRGRSHDPESRIKQHLSHSSNPSIREAVRNGEYVETSILGTFDVITKADADLIERQYIEAIP